ncbi:MAG: right-handed parallel beta-helix repeat-containing protein [Dehalococcoidia bacterium]|nr:right-handed parallel beta-helix repeat-containing protein [Dehalococcoidia bacterium]
MISMDDLIPTRRFIATMVVLILLAAALPAALMAGSPGTAHASGTIIYVDVDATGISADGSSWAKAYTDLQSALTTAVSGDQIWVAVGTYTPSVQTDPSDARTATFQMKKGVGIYGGFVGTETTLGERNVTAHVTILSGDLNGNDIPGDFINNRSDNCYHVFNHLNGLSLDSSAMLDGFTIADGNADNNSAYPDYAGGGMFNENSSPTVTACTFSGNSAVSGGGMENYDSSPTVTNCSFSGNSAVFGGGMYNNASSPTVTNCILWGNTASDQGDQICNDNSMTNISFSDIQDSFDIDNNWDAGLGNDLGGNIDADPLFYNPAAGDFHLTKFSPCVDTGTNTGAPATDFEGEARPYNGTTDMGADEWTLATGPAAPFPEIATAVLLLMGMLGLAGFFRLRKNKALVV